MGLLIGDIAPNFVADTTTGKIHFHEWAGGHWVLLVFHSVDFEQELIPDLIDQNPCAHRRNPMDMIFQGRSMSVFQA